MNLRSNMNTNVQIMRHVNHEMIHWSRHMGIFNWWRRHGGDANNAQSVERINETVERIVTTNPRLRLARRYRARLAPAVATSLNYARDLVAALPPSREASAARWSADPYLRAFFVNPDDLGRAFSNSPDLRAYFDREPVVPEVCAVLGMEMVERQTLGVVMEGEVIRRDVLQTSVSFGDHRVRICGRTEPDLRQEIERRIIDQLALAGLALAAADQSRRDMLEQERALLKTRLRLLERQGTGMRAALGGDAVVGQTELSRLQAQLEENTRNLNNVGIRTEVLDRTLERLREVLAEPAQHIYVTSKHLRLDRMNIVLAANSPQAGEDIEFQIARIPDNPPQMRAFALVRVPRAVMRPRELLLDEAARGLV